MSSVSSSPRRISPQFSPRSESKLKNRSRCCSAMEKLWSVASLILVMIVLTVGVTAGIIWITSFFLYKSSVRDVGKVARQHLINRVSDGVSNFLATGPQMLNVTVDSFQIYELTNNIFKADKETPMRIMNLAFHSPYVLSVKFGWENGTMLGIQPTLGRMYETNGNGTVFFYQLDPQTLEIGKHIGQYQNYFVKKRPWYIRPVVHNRTEWTDFYRIFEEESNFVSTIATPYYSSVTGQFVGVLALECDLDLLSSYLATNPIYKTTRVLVVDSNDTLVATSTSASYSGNSSQTGDTILVDTLKQLRKDNISSPTTDGFRELSYGAHRKKRVATIRPINDDYGIKWLAVANVAEYDILHAAYRAETISACICSASIVLAVIAAIAISLCVALPLRRVRVEMDKVANMHFEKQKDIWSFHLYELNEMVRSLYKMKKGLRSFEKFVPSTVVKTIVRSGRKTCLGVVQRDLSVLFCDIKDFTTMTESIDPNSLVLLLSGFFSVMSDLIVQNQGVVDKFIGDAIMALFNAPDLIENHAVSAVTAAYEMKTRLKEMNQSWIEQKLPPLQIRTGVNSAACLVGNVGSELRMNYTALGDGVNVASRCESLNKRYGTDIMITENTYEAVNHLFLCRWLTVVYLKGKTVPVHVYEVICPTGRAAKEQIELSSLHYDIKLAVEKHQGERAKKLCSDLADTDPDNIAARELLVRLNNCSEDCSLEAIALHLIET